MTVSCKALVEKVTGGAKRGEYWRIGIYAKKGKKKRWVLVDTISGFNTEDEAGRALADLVRMTTAKEPEGGDVGSKAKNVQGDTVGARTGDPGDIED